MYTNHQSLLFMLGNLLLCRLLQQIVLITLLATSIDTRDSKIRPELRTYSLSENQLQPVYHPSRSHQNPVDSPGHRNPIDSVGPESVNKFLSKGSDSEEIEPIDEEDEQQPDSTPSSVRLELNKEPSDNQTTLTDSPDLNKSANETTNSTISMPINQTTSPSNVIDSSITRGTTSEAPLSALTTAHPIQTPEATSGLSQTTAAPSQITEATNGLSKITEATSQTTEATGRLNQTTEVPSRQTTEATSHLNQTATTEQLTKSTANEHLSQTTETSSQSTASDHLNQTTEATSYLEHTATNSHLNETTAATSQLEQTAVSSSHLNETTTATGHFSETTTSGHLNQTTSSYLEQNTVNDHLSLSTEASHNQTSVQPLDQANSSNRTSDPSSTIESRNNETTTIPNFASTTDFGLNLTARNNTPNDSSTAFPHKPCYTLSELELMNCSSCLRCAVILSGNNKSAHLEQFKVILVFSNETFSILDFLRFETKFRNEFELKIRKHLNTSQATIVYEEPFPIVNLNQTVLTILAVNRTFEQLVLSENDLKSSLLNGSQIRSLLNDSRLAIGQMFRMQLHCVDNGLMQNCAYPLIKVKFAVLFVLLQFFIGLVLLTSLMLLIVFCTSRSKSKKQSTKLKAFSEMDNEYQFYDFSDRNLAANPIRLQYLSRIPESEFSDYQRTGIDLADEGDIIREEHLNDQLLLKQSEHPNGCCGSIGKLANKNEKLVFYNPKYERKTHHHNDNFEKPSFVAHRLNNGQSNLVGHLSNHYACDQANQIYGLPLDRENACEPLDSSCDLKFMNCNCARMNGADAEESKAANLLGKSKPPTGRAVASNKPLVNYEIIDTKL